MASFVETEKVCIRLRPIAYLENEGLHLEVDYRDPGLCLPDNKSYLWFLLGSSALTVIAGRPVECEADAKLVTRSNKTIILNAIEKRLRNRGLTSAGGGPRVLLSADLA